MDDDFGTKYVTASRRLSVTSSIFVLGGLLVWMWTEGLLADYPTWLLVGIILWMLYAAVSSVKYYRMGYTNYVSPDE